MLQASKSFGRKWALLATPANMTRLYKYLSEHFKEIKFEATCVDDTTIVFASLNELLEYDNSDSMRIDKVKITAYGENRCEDYLEVSLGQGIWHTVSYTYKYTDLHSGRGIEQELKTRLAELRPWYWFIPTFSAHWLFLGLPAMILFILNIHTSLNRLLNHIPASTTTTINKDDTVALLIVIAMFLFVAGYIVNKFKNYFFPNIFFLWGRQEEVYSNRKEQRKWFYAALVFITGSIIKITAQ